MKKSYKHKKMTKKNKKMGGWKFSSLFKRKPKQEVIQQTQPTQPTQPTQSTKPVINYNTKQLTHRNSNNSISRMFNSYKNKPKLLDRLFTNLCQKKAINYKDNPEKEASGIAYKACKAIYGNVFNKIDDDIEKQNRFKEQLNQEVEDPNPSPGQPKFIKYSEYRKKLLKRLERNKQEQEEAELKKQEEAELKKQEDAFKEREAKFQANHPHLGLSQSHNRNNHNNRNNRNNRNNNN
jgi:hypothetical protein